MQTTIVSTVPLGNFPCTRSLLALKVCRAQISSSACILAEQIFKSKAVPLCEGPQFEHAFCAVAGVGVVEQNGPGAHKFSPGQRVVAVPWPARSNPALDRSKAAGTFQQYLAAPEDTLVQL